MFVGEIITQSGLVRLVRPDVERDAALGVQWLAGDTGRETLRLMGVTDANNRPTTIEAERERVRDFLENQNQLNWMIEFESRVVGAIWVDLQPSEYLKAPSIHIMIGDAATRGFGVGGRVVAAVITWLVKDKKQPAIYSRHLVSNTRAASLLDDRGFTEIGPAYSDSDGLLWQNVELINSEYT